MWHYWLFYFTDLKMGEMGFRGISNFIFLMGKQSYVEYVILPEVL